MSLSQAFPASMEIFLILIKLECRFRFDICTKAPESRQYLPPDFVHDHAYIRQSRKRAADPPAIDRQIAQCDFSHALAPRNEWIVDRTT